MKDWKWVIIAAVFVLMASLPLYTGSYFLHTVLIIMIYMSLAVSWDMLVRTGQISFGIAGLFGVGSYASCVLQAFIPGLNPLISIVFGAVMAGVVALLLGLATLRLRGMYFAIITLAMAEIFRVIIRNLPDTWTGGAMGIVLPNAIFNGDLKPTYWMILVITVLTVIISEIFNRSRIHFAITSIRNDEIVAMSSGIDIFKYLVAIFVITSVLQGMVGGAYAQIYGSVNPEANFAATWSLLPLAMALFGGMHTTWGPIIGALILGLASEYLKLVIPYGYLIVYGIIIILVILFLPKGIMGLIKRLMEKK
jgi:branched-chain amino acid transport system permease protein